ncbi:MAG TPA: Trm112 family protein [Thermoanaerobaculia bacterium]
MAVDPELLAILVCPKTKGPLELVDLDDEARRALVEKYREKFRDEEPVVTQGLLSRTADLVYPIVSDIPVMLIDEALPASAGSDPRRGSDPDSRRKT